MSRYRSQIIISLFLIITTLAAYWEVPNHDFVNIDDDAYVTDNRYVKSGWTWEGVHWAFTTRLHDHWHPLTWLSHMTDYQLFGPNPGGHHLTSLFLHIVNTLLLFLVLQRMTGALLRSGFVAALFALHPLHVEPVVWVADRKDVLCAFFWILTMWTYIRYSERPGFKRYLPVIVAFVLGLMAKPMIVTLPCVLLLMDYWPLGRFQVGQSIGGQGPQNNTLLTFKHQIRAALRLVWEKVPLFVAAGVSVVVAMMARDFPTIEGIDPSELYPARNPVTNALFAYVSYIHKMLWPVNLAIPYPKPDTFPIWQVGGAGLLLCGISFLVFWRGRRHPYLPVGWLWYVGTLLPVVGLLEHGPQAIADRYTYVPLIGLFIMIAWGVPDILATPRYRRLVLGISTGILFLGLMTLTRSQVRHWENSFTLFGHSIQVTADNLFAYNNLGVALERQGRLEEAISHYHEALRIKPDCAGVHNNLGHALKRQGRLEEAFEHLSKALRMKPAYADAHNNLGAVLELQGRINEAMGHFSEALRIEPEYAKAHYNLGVLLERQGKVKEASEHFSAVLRINPHDAKAHNSLGATLEVQGRLKEAMDHFSEALRIRPDYAKAHYNLGVTLGKQGRLEEAISHYYEALRLRSDYAQAHNNIGNALKQQGRLEEAVRHFSEALRIKPDYAKAQNNLERTLQLMGKSSGAQNAESIVTP